MRSVAFTCYCNPITFFRTFYLLKSAGDNIVREISYGHDPGAFSDFATKLAKQPRTSYIDSVEALILSTHHHYVAYLQWRESRKKIKV